MTVETKAATAAKTLEAAAVQAKENYEGILKAGQDQAAKTLEQTAAVTKEQIEKISSQMLKTYADLQELGKGNVEALIESGTIATRGAEDLGREVTAYAQSTFDRSISTGKAILTAKSVKEVIDLQAEFAKSSMDGFLSEASRIQELTSSVTNAAMAPLNARLNVAVETFTKPIAA